jgi:hypothetical protein
VDSIFGSKPARRHARSNVWRQYSESGPIQRAAARSPSRDGVGVSALGTGGATWTFRAAIVVVALATIADPHIRRGPTMAAA